MLLEVSGLAAGYLGEKVVSDIDLEVSEGEAVAIVGSNGAGKSTLLRALAGLLRPMEGRVRLAGRDLTRRPAHRIARAGVAYVPAERHLFPSMTVKTNLALGAYPHRPDRGALELVLDLFPRLAERQRQRAGTLSGGEQQMLAVGRALVRRPRLLLLDELSLGLAPVIVERLLPVVREYATQEGCAVLLVEQHVGLALDVADRAYVLSHGRISLHRPAAELRGNHELLLASYLGEQATAAS
jgi:branched-chain amino acid transport system ATP-binding protein